MLRVTFTEENGSTTDLVWNEISNLQIENVAHLLRNELGEYDARIPH